MNTYNCDLHYHSPYAAACSKNITIPSLAKEAVKKGLDILTTADILHPIWRKHVKENIIEDKDDCYKYKEKINGKEIFFILGTEIETEKRIHHLLYFKNFIQIEKFIIETKAFCQNMAVYGSGRTKFKTTSENILNICKKLNILIGPAHAFTPYFGVYGHYKSLKEAYGNSWEYIKFIELGLSADTYSANIIPDLIKIKFFSFSDSHSQFSYRIGREYISLSLEKPNFENLKALLDNTNKNKINYNVGYNPLEGKYNRTACRKCHQLFTLKQAEDSNWKCSVCKGIIKKGVFEKCEEIAKHQGNIELKQITNRPEYKFLIPLAQVIQLAINEKNINQKKVIEIYETFIEKYTEIEIMQSVPFEKLKLINENIAKYIIAFRKDYVVFKPGGAGQYGTPIICFSEKEKKDKQKEINENLYLKDSQTKLFF